jgi:hypothetical protein
MNLPSFTAEATLYKSSGRYHMAARSTPTGLAVVPQYWFPPPLCTYDTCINKWDCGADPVIDCKVIGKTSQRCCSWLGLPTECTTVGCPAYCLEKKANWLADCKKAAPDTDIEPWCSAEGENHYKHCQATGEWPVAMTPAIRWGWTG